MFQGKRRRELYVIGKRRKVKMRLTAKGVNGLAGCLVILVVLAISAAVGGFCWPYALNKWLVFFGKEPKVVFWQGALLGFVPWLGQASIPFAVLTWVLMMFLV